MKLKAEKKMQKYQFYELFHAMKLKKICNSIELEIFFFSCYWTVFRVAKKNAERMKRSATIEYPDKINFLFFLLYAVHKKNCRVGKKTVVGRILPYRVQHNSIHIFSFQSALCLKRYWMRKYSRGAKRAKKCCRKSCYKK